MPTHIPTNTAIIIIRSNYINKYTFDFINKIAVFGGMWVGMFMYRRLVVVGGLVELPTNLTNLPLTGLMVVWLAVLLIQANHKQPIKPSFGMPASEAIKNKNKNLILFLFLLLLQKVDRSWPASSGFNPAQVPF